MRINITPFCISTVEDGIAIIFYMAFNRHCFTTSLGWSYRDWKLDCHVGLTDIKRVVFQVGPIYFLMEAE